MTSIKEFLEQMIKMRGEKREGWSYNSIEDFILQNGEEMYAISLPKEYWSNKGQHKECFKNAFHLAESHNLTYCEGYAFSIAIPMVHAWCIDENNNVIDPTWNNPEECEYYGVKFDIDYVRKTIFDKGTYGVIDNYENKFPLITGKDVNF